jgi:hypothetical protein
MCTVSSFSGEDLGLLACKAGKLHLGKQSFLEVPGEAQKLGLR